jgi:hypothetical protein
MKRIASAFAAFVIAIAGLLATPSVGSVAQANAATVKPHAAHRAPATPRGPYASARDASGRGGAPASVNARGDTKPGEKEPPPSIPYDADGPAYLPGQTRSTDFQLQH